MMKRSQVRGVETNGGTEQPGRPQVAAEPPTVARWRAAEGRLYPLIMVDPVGYEAAVTLVCEAADVLRSECGTGTELLHADAAGVLAQCASASTMTALGFDPSTAFDAACAHRWRELSEDRPAAGPGSDQDGAR